MEHFKKKNYRFVVDNTNEAGGCFDWYNAKFIVDFKLELLAGGNIAVDDHNGIVNSAHALISSIIVKVNGIQVYDNNMANYSTNIKNLLEYNQSYSSSTATNQLYYLDNNRSAEERPAEALYNKGFAMRKAILGTSTPVNVEIPLCRYSFFEAFENELMPNTRVELILTLEQDINVVWAAGENCRIKLLKWELWLPKITFTAEGQSQYISKYLRPHQWSYLREIIMKSNSTQNGNGTFKISSGIEKPRYVFVWISNDANFGSRLLNYFLFNTFNVADNKTLTSCHLEISNGIKYPKNEYQPSSSISRVFRDALNFVHGNNDFSGGTLLTRSNFSTIFPFFFF